jgi:LacI family transcriptional regulator
MCNRELEQLVTIKEVAKLAGVAVSTASNALNGKYGVKASTQKKVQEAAKKLNYIPNPYAQGLVKHNNRIISMVLSGPNSMNFITNPAFEEIIKSVTRTLNRHGYQAMLNMISSDEEEEAIVKLAQSQISNALILITTRTPDDILERILEKISIPSVVLIRNALNKDIASISLDNKDCGYKATKYLIENGHRRIAFIGELPGVSIAEERLAGYRQALVEANIEFDPSYVIPADYYQESGLIGVRQLLRQCSHKPTAIFAGNDIVALGVMEGIVQEGLSIPDDISLIGHDNIPNLHLLKVSLTTIASPYVELGRLAAHKVMGMIEGNDQTPIHTVMQSEIRVRSSVKSI